MLLSPKPHVTQRVDAKIKPKVVVHLIWLEDKTDPNIPGKWRLCNGVNCIPSAFTKDRWEDAGFEMDQLGERPALCAASWMWTKKVAIIVVLADAGVVKELKPLLTSSGREEDWKQSHNCRGIH